MASFVLGPGSLFKVINAELLPLIGNALLNVIDEIFEFLIAYYFLQLEKLIKYEGIFIIFAIILLISISFLLFLFKETKDLSRD